MSVNVDLVRGAFDAFMRGEVDRALESREEALRSP
jgi:hypothetical protein